MPTTEAELAARIDSTGLLGKDGQPKERAAAPAARPQTRTPAPQPEPEDETPTALEDDANLEGETAEESEDLSDEATEREAGASDDVKELRREIADLKALLGKNRDAASTDKAGGAAAPSAESAKTTAAFAKVRDKLAKAKETWGELIDAVGLADLVDELEAERTKQAETQQQTEMQAKIEAANNVHRAMNNMARNDPALMKAIGIGLHETIKPHHMDTRRRVFAAATRAMEDAQDELQAGTRTKAMTESEALAIGILRVTGREVAGGNASAAAAKDRARMARPLSGTTTAASKTTETQEQVEARLAARADEFLRGHNR